MTVKSAVVLVVDRLGAGWLGPYGNTWLDTPHFNHLAAESALFETVIADSPDLTLAYRTYWTGRHVLQPTASNAHSLAQLAANAGVPTWLISDSRAVIELHSAFSFAERSCVQQHDVDRCAAAIEQTGLHLLLKEAARELSGLTRPFLYWIHTEGMNGPGDAPLEMRYQFADEDDPIPPDFVAPPAKMLAPGYDPDSLLGLTQAYAGQVALVDYCLGTLLEALDEHPLGSETLLVVTSPRGYPLGEHLRVGPCDDALYGELLHVPLLVRMPQRESALTRVQGIVQPHQLLTTIAEICGWMGPAAAPSGLVSELRGGSVPQGNIAVAVAPGQRAIRTPAWFLRESPAEGGVKRELFAKPDDRWEANEISSRCGDIIELLASRLDEFEVAARNDQFAELPPLAEPLCDTWR